ncbi:Uncharacterised protein g7681 [Pycnogonum litorale]
MTKYTNLRKLAIFVSLVGLIYVIGLILSDVGRIKIVLDTNVTVEEFFRYVEAPPAPCYKTVKLGGKKTWTPRNYLIIDGDKMICLDPGSEPRISDCLIYSFGSGRDFSFEKAAKKRYKCEIHTFDPTTEQRSGKNHSVFHKYGISDKNGVSKTANGINSIMKDLKTIKYEFGHQNKRIDILKIDIEGSEFRILNSLINTDELKVSH